MSVVPLRWARGRVGAWALFNLSLHCALDSVDQGLCIALFVRLGFFATLEARIFFPFPSPNLEAVPGILLPAFWFSCSFGVFFGLACFSFLPIPRPRRSWTQTRKDIKIHQFWLLRGGDPLQKFNNFPSALLQASTWTPLPLPRDKGTTHHFAFQACVFFFPGHFWEIFLFCCSCGCMWLEDKFLGVHI